MKRINENFKVDYQRIPLILKRYTFESKMKIAQQYSRSFMRINGVDVLNKLGIHPWELETFVLLTIMGNKEYGSQKFNRNDRKSDRQFRKIISGIKDFLPSAMKQANPDLNFLEVIMIPHTLSQFSIQENIFFKIYRYSFIFGFKNEKIDMKKRFGAKFQTTFDDFKSFGIIANTIFSSEMKQIFNQNKVNNKDLVEVTNFLFLKYENVLNQLSKERKLLIDNQKKITPKIEDYHYGYKTFSEFPIIKNEGISYLPLPHLLIDATTKHLLTRLTSGDNQLRQLVGKEVLEDYVLHLISLCPFIEEISPEVKFKLNGNEARSADAMLRKKQSFILIDCKLMVPKKTLANLSVDDVMYTRSRLSESIIQMYKQIHERFLIKYQPFENKYENIKGNIFGVILIFEGAGINPETAYLEAGKKLGIEDDKDKIQFLKMHIRIVELYQFERMMFNNHDIFELLDISIAKGENYFTESEISRNANFEKSHLKTTVQELQRRIKEFALDFQAHKNEKILIQRQKGLLNTNG